MGGGGIAIGRLLGIIPCRLTHGRGILGVVLPLASRLPLVTGRLLRIIRWVAVPGGMLAFPPRRSLKSWRIGGVVMWLMLLLNGLSITSTWR